jgi:serine/threonine-protein kinase
MFPSYPHKFGTYTVDGRVCPQRQGTVFQAYDYVTERGPHYVALKILPISLHDPRREHLVSAFFRQADALSQLHHPQLCRVLDFGAYQDKPYLAMEWLHAPTLGSRLVPLQSWEPKAALVLVRQVAQAVQELHRAEVVHRDLKPDNIFLFPERGPVLGDLGNVHTRPLSVWSEEASLPGATQLYLSPEQVRGMTSPEPTSDIFSLAVILYQLLTGRMPFEAATPAEMLHQIQHISPLPPSLWNRQVPACVDAFLWHALAKEPGDRVPNMEAFNEGLELCLKQLETVSQPSATAVSLADFSAQLERSMASHSRRPEPPVQFTSEGGIAPKRPPGQDLFGTVAPVSRQPAPSRPQEPEWMRARRQMQKRTQQLAQQLEQEERSRRQEQERQDQQRRRAEMEQAEPEQLRAWCRQYPTDTTIRRIYLTRRTPELAAQDRAEVGRAAKVRRAWQGFFLGGLLGLVLGLVIGVVVSRCGGWGWAGGAAAGGACLGIFGGLGGGPKGAASAGGFGAGVGALGGALCSSLIWPLILLCLGGGLALFVGLCGAWVGGGTAAKEWAELGPLPAGAYSMPLEQAKQVYLEE